VGALPRGNARGVALLARVRRTYTHYRGVVITGRIGALAARFTLRLDAGAVVGEGFSGTRGAGTTELVALPGSSTFARDPGSSCWRPVPATDPQALTDIGHHFPFAPSGVPVEAPQPNQHGWSLSVQADGRSSTFTIDRATLLVQSITVRAPGKSVTELVRTLAPTPILPTPQPRC
jgi:hypothetical protein